MALPIRGVNYDVGTNFAAGELSRDGLTDERLREELLTIRNDLHADSVAIYGTPLDRLVRAATIAAEAGLRVWLQPRLVDGRPRDLLDRLTEAARAAEDLRRGHGHVVLSVGCELSIFARGVVPGRGYERRMARLGTMAGYALTPWFTRRLNRLLGRAAAVVRSVFGGPVTYAQGSWEQVDWTPFDLVCVNLYRTADNAGTYAEELAAFQRHGKPLVISEFGCAAFDGAAELGPLAHEVVELGGPRPTLKGPPVRNERVQADHLAELLDLYEAARVEGAFVYEFIEPAYHHSPDPRHDLDMAGYGLVKVLPTGGDGYTWHPKAAFHTVSERFARGGGVP
ncbi:hypothetical protein HII36_07295 [Nonomuraea sp. NN258]|uniref:hypothetical protein n=1 Tax=Nonomuraea antri TaxID=2730852 RepID=UPI0015696147|nr:hypothetical protein [Nonomuraea antri]NRQ31646.1 hypothetical protein [Nonomuraea antri]